MYKLFKNLTSFLPLTMCLASCGTGNQDPEPSDNLKLSALTFVDSGLKACVERYQEFMGWETIADVVELNCSKTSKAQPALDRAIWDTSDISHFVHLEELSLAGNAYTELDISALTKLKRLDLHSGFILELDARNNPDLEAIDASSTPIRRIDLSANSRLKELRLSSFSVEAELYQNSVMEDLDLLLEFANLPLTKGDNLRQLSRDIIVNTKVELHLHPSAQLEVAELKYNTITDLPDNTQLKKARGHFTTTSISNASNLIELRAELSGTEALDLRDSTLLRSIFIESQELTEILIPENITSMTLRAPIQKISIDPDSKLTTIRLRNTITEQLPLNVNLFPALETLKVMTLANFDLGENVDLSKHSNLARLGISNARISAQLTLPETTTNLMLENLIDHPIIQPTSNMRTLSLIYVPATMCGLNDAQFESLTSIAIEYCHAEEVDLRDQPLLEHLSVKNSDIQNIEFPRQSALQSIRLEHTKIVFPDLTTLQGYEPRDRFRFINNMMTEYDIESIKAAAEGIFETITVYRAEPKNIDYELGEIFEGITRLDLF